MQSRSTRRREKLGLCADCWSELENDDEAWKKVCEERNWELAKEDPLLNPTCKKCGKILVALHNVYSDDYWKNGYCYECWQDINEHE